MVFSIPRETAIDVAKQYNIPEYTDNWRDIVERKDIDAVLIATPNYTHREIAVEAARRGKHIFLEKPIALRVKEGEEIVMEAEKNRVKLFVGHCLRFWPEYVKVREAIISGYIGEPRVARAYRLAPFPSWTQWHKYADLSGGVVIDLSIHDIDYLRWVLGPIESVYAVGGIFTKYSYDSIDHYMAIMKFENGAIAYVEGSWAMPRSFPFTTYLEIAGTRGLLTVDNRSTLTVGIYRDNSSEFYAPYYNNAYFEEMKAFLDWLQFDKKPPIDPWEAVEALRIAWMIMISIKEGRVVKVREVVY